MTRDIPALLREAGGSRQRPARLVAAVVRHYLTRRPRDAAWLAAWSTVEAVPTFVLGGAIAGATDAFLNGRSHFVAGLGWLTLLVAAAVVGSVGSRNAYIRLAAIVEPLRDDLVRRIVTGAVSRCVDHGEPPDTGATARISHQAELVRDSFGGMVSALRRFVFIAGSALVGLGTLLPMALVLAVGPLLAGLAIFAALVGAFARKQRDYVLTEEAVAADSTTVMTSLRDITACGGEDQMYTTLARRIDAQVRATGGVARMAAARSLAIAVGGWLPISLVLAAAPWMVHGGATAGQIVGALTYLTGGLQPALRTLVQGVGSSGIRMVVTLERIMERAAPPPSAAGQRAARGITAPADPRDQADRCDIDLRELTFGYGPRAIPVISDLSLFVPDGDHLAIVGPSGVGKSTLAGLIAGMLTPRTGQVRLGGTPVCQLSAAALTGRRVLIPQEAYVFAGTLRENLTYLNPQASPAEVDEAAGAVGSRSLAARLGGYDAAVDPATFSAGERQLIALTRAYLSAARVALLDEATCHLDPAAEAKAEHAFARRPGTLVVIAHRMSSALRARRVLVLDGDRADLGTHESLLGRSALYRDLAGYWADQSQPAPSAMRMASTRLRAPVFPMTREIWLRTVPTDKYSSSAISVAGAPWAARRSTSVSRAVSGLVVVLRAEKARSGSSAFPPAATWRIASVIFSGADSITTKPSTLAATASRSLRGL
jgi:ATP-binding cassette, subfamily C, bacterial